MKQIINRLKTSIPKKRIEREFPYASSVLLILTLTIVFVLPIFPKLYFTFFHNALINGIFIAAVFSIKRNHIFLVAAAVILSIAIWISQLADMEIVTQISRIIQFFFFLFLVGSLIGQVARIDSVTLEVI